VASLKNLSGKFHYTKCAIYIEGRTTIMKYLGYFSIALGLTTLTLWTATLGIELAEKIHYLPTYFRTSNLKSQPEVISVVHDNAFIADDSTDPVPVPIDHPPLKIICGAHIFRVVYASHDWMIRKKNPAYASSIMEKELIVLDRQRNSIEVREDVLHELMHIALWEAGGKDINAPNEEEAYVKAAAPTLRDILADNPLLVKWLVKAGG
jgi:hypothetical protein